MLGIGKVGMGNEYSLVERGRFGQASTTMVRHCCLHQRHGVVRWLSRLSQRGGSSNCRFCRFGLAPPPLPVHIRRSTGRSGRLRLTTAGNRERESSGLHPLVVPPDVVLVVVDVGRVKHCEPDAILFDFGGRVAGHRGRAERTVLFFDV